MRGYLWERLNDEIAEVFAHLSSVVPSDITDEGYSVGSLVRLNLDWMTAELAEEKRVLGEEWAQKVRVRPARFSTPGMTSYQRTTVVRARRAAEGRCVECENKREPGNSRCSMHRQKQKEYCRARRKMTVS